MTVLKKLEEKRREYKTLEELNKKHKKQAASEIAHEISRQFKDEIEEIDGVSFVTFTEDHGKAMISVKPEDDILESVPDDELLSRKEKVGVIINQQIRKLLDTEAEFIVDINWEGHQVLDRLRDLRTGSSRQGDKK